MKKEVITMIILSFILINLNCITASSNNINNGNITLNYPSEVNLGEVFTVGLKLDNFLNDSYDIRIGVMDNTSRISRILNGNIWQSTYYYINDAINTNTQNNGSFLLNITDCYNGEYDLEIKIRDSKGNLYNFYNHTINVNCETNDNEDNTEDTQDTNDSSDETDDTQNSEETIVSLILDYNSGDIVNGNEFEIKLSAYDLEDKTYDIKVFIYDDNENSPISQTYYDGKWISSNNYIDKIFRGPGDIDKDIKLRIKDSYKDFEGEATIGVRIRVSGESNYEEEIQDTIDILSKEEVSTDEETDNTLDTTQDTIEDSNIIIDETSEDYPEDTTQEEVVNHLNSKSESIKSKKVIYKSKNERIKEYSVYLFLFTGIILMGLFILLIIKAKMKK